MDGANTMKMSFKSKTGSFDSLYGKSHNQATCATSCSGSPVFRVNGVNCDGNNEVCVSGKLFPNETDRKKTILFLCDQLPFPPRNGVTIPAYHQLLALREHYRVIVLWLRFSNNSVDETWIPRNQVLCDEFQSVIMEKGSAVHGLMREIIGKSGVYSNWKYDKQALGPITNRHFDCIWAASSRAAAYLPRIMGDICLSDKPRLVTAINDCHTNALRVHGRSTVLSGHNISSRLWGVAQWLRSWPMARIERRLLVQMDDVIVQSKTDKSWLARIGVPEADTRVRIISNGVESDAYPEWSSTRKPVIGLIEQLDLSGGAATAKWLCKDVLPEVRRTVSKSELQILGRTGPVELMRKLREDGYTKHVARVECIQDFLSSIRVMVVRVRKSMGIINRTLDSMAAGKVVCGDPGAFHGISGFRDGTHGFVCNSTENFVERIQQLLSDANECARIGQNARLLMRHRFDWKSRYRQYQDILLD